MYMLKKNSVRLPIYVVITLKQTDYLRFISLHCLMDILTVDRGLAI